MKNYGYLRVSTEDQQHGPAAQRETILRSVVIDEWFEEHASGKNLSGRPVFTDLLDRACKEQACIVVSKLDRLGRSVVDVLNVFEQVKECGAQIKVLDLGIDTSTPVGEMMLTMLAAFAQFERRMISQRTKDALAAAKKKGVRLGAPNKLSDDDMASIRTKRMLSVSPVEIAAEYGISTRTVYRIWEGLKP